MKRFPPFSHAKSMQKIPQMHLNTSLTWFSKVLTQNRYGLGLMGLGFRFPHHVPNQSDALQDKLPDLKTRVQSEKSLHSRLLESGVADTLRRM